MKILVLAVHPHMETSVVNKAWAEELSKHDNITVRDLYKEYPDEEIDVAKEQQPVRGIRSDCVSIPAILVQLSAALEKMAGSCADLRLGFWFRRKCLAWQGADAGCINRERSGKISSGRSKSLLDQ